MIKVRSNRFALASVLTLCLNTAALIVFTPLFIRVLGAERYGYWLVIQAVAAACMLVEYGGYGTLARRIASHLDESESNWHGLAAALYRNYMLRLLIVALLAVPVVLYICRHAERWDVGVAWALVALGAWPLLYLRMKAALLIGAQRIPLERMLQCLNTMAGLVLGLSFCSLHPSLAALALGSLLGSLIASWVSRIAVPSLRFTVPPQLTAEHIRQAYPQGVVNVSGFIMTGISPLLVGAALGGGQVVVYSLALRLSMLTTQMFQAILNSHSVGWGKIFAESGLSVALVEVQQFGRRLLPYILASFAVYAWLSPRVISIWTHGEVDVPAFLPVVLAVSAVIVVYDNICAAFVNAVKVANQFSASAIYGAAFYFLLAGGMGYLYGVQGVAVGGLLAHGLTTSRASFSAYIVLTKARSI